MRHPHTLALLAALTLNAGAALADDQRDQDWAWCANANGDQSVDRVIDGCSAVIQQGQAEPERMAAAYANRAAAYRGKGILDRALEDIDDSLRLAPDRAATIAGRGALYVAQGRYDAAMRDYDQALRLEPDNLAAVTGRGLASFLMARYRIAANDLARAIALGNTSIDIALWQHMALARDGRAGESKLRDVAFDPAAWPGAAVRLFLRQAKPDDVIAAAHAGDPAGEDARLCQAYFYLGQAAVIAGDPTAATQLMRAAVDTGATATLEYRAARGELVRLAQ